MAGRILVVDDLEPNRRLLQVRLEAEYYDVVMAGDGAEALAVAASTAPDLILLDVMMPLMDGFEACRRLKANPKTAHVPVVMVTALDQQSDRVAGLDAGADDFITKPIDDVGLLARVRSLLRLKMVMDELRQREASGRAIGAIEQAESDDSMWRNANVLVVGDPGRTSERLTERLAEDHAPVLETDPRRAAQTASGRWDLIIIDLTADNFDGMRLAARLRSDNETRHAPILAIVDPDARERMVQALDLGVNDILRAPVDPLELSARVRTQVKRKRYADYLRATLDQSMELAVTDQLTGLHNRRFMTTQLSELVERSGADHTPLSVMITDIDHFKRVNDTYGHDVGDFVLREFARRLSANVRAVDLACRFGGEEFVVMMPGADIEQAKAAAERFRAAVAAAAFQAGAGGQMLDVTTSVGVSALHPGDSADKMLKRADQALYAAKERGRDRVVVARLRSAA